MNIILFGTGNVAWHLAKALGSKIQIAGRNQKKAQDIANQTGAIFSEKINPGLVILAIQDSAISEVSKKLNLDQDSLLVHTSGSMSMGILEGKSRRGCFYPMQTFSRGADLDYSRIPFFIEAENPADEKILFSLAQKISSKVMVCDSEKRKFVHLTAVFVCNFVNHLYARAEEVAKSQDIPFDYFKPLMEQTLDKLNTLNPHEAQTGPASRGEIEILKSQAMLLKGRDRRIYEMLSASILKDFYPELPIPF